MKVQMLPLALTALVVVSNSQSIFANDPVVREPDAIVRTGDIVAINVSKILEAVDESHPQFSTLRNIKLIDQRELGAWPIVVLKDGTISLPLLKPLRAHGLTINDLENRILQSYVLKKIVRPGEITVIAARIADKK